MRHLTGWFSLERSLSRFQMSTMIDGNSTLRGAHPRRARDERVSPRTRLHVRARFGGRGASARAYVKVPLATSRMIAGLGGIVSLHVHSRTICSISV